MRRVECVVIGGGPAGLMSARTLLESGCQVIIVDRFNQLGGQLVKQTHKFFGSKDQYAGLRGYEIADALVDSIVGHPNLEVILSTDVVALYPEGIVALYDGTVYQDIQAERIILATGASEKFLAFENNDLPGVMGAGAIQTLMNVHGVLFGKEVVMIGSGNIGLIVSYQLIQAGVKVKAVVEYSDTIGGYQVHAMKLKRLGVPFYMSSTVQKAIGTDCVEGVEIVSRLDQSKTIVDCDTVCVAVGLTPAIQLGSMLDAKTKIVNELGGEVLVINKAYQTSIETVYVCGDAAGIEEASSAMVEGALCGLMVAKSLNKTIDQQLVDNYTQQLHQLRQGPFGEKSLTGLKRLRGNAYD